MKPMKARVPESAITASSSYNDLQQYDRIGMEFQANWGGSSEPTLFYAQYNSFHNLLNPHQQDFDISMANGCASGFNTSGITYCVAHVDDNVSGRYPRRGLR